ncbi:MAG: ATP-binding cassette domain-containing protein [Candidatus Krumholzibacteria bacterium]|nr:ATP-binding cassette domain-containing protein [Candidatus Krumholzibacteria bacterium]
MLEVDGLSKRLGDFSMRDVSFEVGAGEYFVLLGASGTGKTVLLETLTGIISPDSGRVVLRGRDITRIPPQRRSLGVVFQDQVLFPHLSVRGNIAYGPSSRRMGRAQTNKAVERLARETGAEHLLDRRPKTLSGGEAQRVALARALATGPDCLLLDEPLSSLDTVARADLRALLRRLHASGTTIVHISHDYEEAVSLATRIGVMENGTIVQTDTPEEILMHPRSEFVARFVGIRNMYRGRLERGERDASRFIGRGIELDVLTDAGPGPCVALVRGEDVTIELQHGTSSARNVIAGTVREVLPARLGFEAIIDAGVEIAAHLAGESVFRMGLRRGMSVFVSIKASAVRVIQS